MRHRTILTLMTLIWLLPDCSLGSEDQPAGAGPVYFASDVVPILTRRGCNSGGCHGKATGQNGFKLSLFGFDPEFDHSAIVTAQRGRRIFPADPGFSLLLKKATGAVPHGGGRRITEASDDYRMLVTWIENGARAPRPDDPVLERIALTPGKLTMSPGDSVQLKVTGYLSDGSKRDMTGRAVYQSNEPGIADVDENGLILTTNRSGLASVMAQCNGKIATVSLAVPFQKAHGSASAERFKSVRQSLASPVDRFMADLWQRLNVIPSSPASDATFIRRATLDICGTLPTPAEVRAYVEDSSKDKRRRLIDRLLERPEYAALFALKWADILQNRGAGYSTSRQREGTTLFSDWIRDSIEQNKPYNEFVAEIITASGSQQKNPPAVWYRTIRKPTEYVESVAQAFLGIRIQCAQCHHHPTERWSQADYYGLAAVFARVGRKGGFADGEVPTNEVIYLKKKSDVKHPRTGTILNPRPPGGKEFPVSEFVDPRQQLVQWMTTSENPYFARTMVNRIWAHFLGRGIVHPIDDARSTNPAINPQLLDWLAKDFVNGGFDVKHLIRTVTQSYAYGLASEPEPGNSADMQTFARFYPRRMTAEVLLDSMSQVLDVPTNFKGFPTGTRAVELPDENVAAHFLDVFGRPARMSACECERVDAPSLTQALELVNSAEIQRKLSSDNGYAHRISSSDISDRELAEDLFLRVLSRPPSPDEIKTVTTFLGSEPDRRVAVQDIAWSLLATNEFLLIH